jgi:hypothetical protein
MTEGSDVRDGDFYHLFEGTNKEIDPLYISREQ